MQPPSFVATLKLDDEALDRLNALRKQYFPPARNFLDAHVTLFHKLTAESLTILEGAVAEIAPRSFEVELARPYSLGRGVAIRIESECLLSIRNQLATRLHADLSAQDRQPYKPHVTIQNKVTAEEASKSLVAIGGEWNPGVARVEGIDLWEYLGGPWQHHGRLVFQV
ncbi:2'-5' RNA ligase family protein [Isosphaeraceae bacterium EP7]